MQFFKVTYDWHVGVALVAVDLEAEQFFRYVASTGLWHLEQELSNGYLFGDGGAQFSEISPAAAAAMMPQLPKYDLRSPRKRHVLQGYELQMQQSPDQVRTSAEVGLTMQQISSRPTKAPGMAKLIRGSGKYRVIALYDGSRDAKKRQRAAEALSTSAAATLSSGKVEVETKVEQKLLRGAVKYAVVGRRQRGRAAERTVSG
ncbi:hypothetical protein [Agrococcus casei]|uniref:Uncharacterized protein n=1 Tax=Agrococcus casei LMG 22410 TaxID=1255656 RepID=A0A1R4FJA4_9MICO|nr:hypothetical protein [Agrococcus casei]SJM55978.1 hypothetical protein CZ674_04800 [Agrococcus casei LMG 22410]